MTRNQRIGLLAAAVGVAVVALVIALAGGDDKNKPKSAATGNGTQPTPTSEPTEPEVTHISVKGGVLDGDAQTIDVKKNDIVRIVVSSDAPDEIHLHGYDIEKEAAPGEPARFKFKANVEGSFIIESHAAEDAGNDPLLARLHVEP